MVVREVQVEVKAVVQQGEWVSVQRRAVVSQGERVAVVVRTNERNQEILVTLIFSLSLKRGDMVEMAHPHQVVLWDRYAKFSAHSTQNFNL